MACRLIPLEAGRPYRLILLPLLVLGAFLLSGGIAQGQSVTAAINGTIRDPSGAPMPGASVVATEVNRGTNFQATSNASGSYHLPPLPVGTYRVTVSAPGFQTEALPPITLVLNQVAKLDFKMEVGKVSQVVRVTSQAPLLQMESTQVSTLINAKTNTSLPLASRNYLQLALLAPGAVSVNPTSLYTAQTMLGSGQFYINGNREQDNSILLDGMYNNELSDNEVSYSPSPDAIEEFNLITQNAPAEFGNFQGGIVSVETKAGTNHDHGDVWEFFRNNVLNANSWSNDLLNAVNHSDVAPREGLRWNMFGGTLGGPIKKNKLFFFVDYQGQRFETVGAANYFSALTGPERAGDFGQLCTDPGNGGGSFNPSGICSPGKGQQVTDPFTGANIPFNNLGQYIASNADPQLTAYYNNGGGKVLQNVLNSPYYPSLSSLVAGSGTAANPGIVDNYVYQERSPFNVDQGDFRMDWDPSGKDHAFWRYSREQTDNDQTASSPVIAVPAETDTVWNAVGDWTHVFNAKVLNDLRAGVNRTYLNQTMRTATPANFGATVGIAGATGLPGVNPAPSSSFGSNGQVITYADTEIQAEDNLGLTLGRHSINMGFQFLRERLDTFFAGGGGLLGEYDFGGNFSGTGDTDLYLGMSDDEIQHFTNAPPGVYPEWGQRSSVMGAYFQDDWRLRDNLTLNLGLRFQANTPWVEAHGRELNFDIQTGQPIYPAGHPLPSTVTFPGLQPIPDSNQALYNGYYGIGDYEPRIGFAYTPRSGAKATVIRGAYTISDYMEGTGNNLRPTQNIPFNLDSQTYNTCSGGAAGCNPAKLEISNGIVTNLSNQFSSARLNAWASNVRPSMSQQWSLGVQQELLKATALQLTYLGQHGTHLMVPLEALQGQLQPNGTVLPSPNFADNAPLVAQGAYVEATTSIGNQSYDALQAVLQQHLSNGLEGQVSYTYSHCLTDNIGFYGDSGQASSASAYWQNIYDPRAEWGSCYFDVTHALTAYAVYALPFGKGQSFGGHTNPVVNGLLGNWTISPIYTLHGGFPLTITEANDYSGTNSFGPRADCNGKPQYKRESTPVGIQWFNSGVYSNPADGTFGTCGVSTVRGPGLDTVDVSLQKNFPIRDKTYLEFRSEFINALNHPIFNAPAAACSGAAGTTCSAGLGLVTTSQGERNIQFALKLYY